MKILALCATVWMSFAFVSITRGENGSEKRALIVVTSNDQLGNTGKKTGWYLSEVTHVYYPLTEAGFQIDFASPNGGKTSIDAKSLKFDDPDNKKFLADPNLMSAMENTIPVKEIDPTKYQIIHFAGGHGAMWNFPNNKEIERITSSIYENEGVVSAVCHGPAALVGLKLSNGKYLVDGKNVNSFTNREEAAVELSEIVPFLLETKLKEQGAIFIEGDNWQEKVVVSERLITGQNPQSAGAVATKILETVKLTTP